MCVTKMSWDDIPKNPFRVPTNGTDKNVQGNLNSHDDIAKCTLHLLAEHEIHPNCRKNNVVKAGNCTIRGTVVPCFHVDQINDSIVEECTKAGTYDYFSNSKLSFILTFLGMTTFFCGKFFTIPNTFL